MSAIRRIVFLAVCGLCILASLLFYARWIDPFDDQSFDSTKWLQSSPCSRGNMARDAARHTIGLFPSEVVDMLGVPAETRTNLDEHTQTLVYRIGAWPDRGIEHAELTVYINDCGLVQTASVFRVGESKPLHYFPNRG